MADPTLPDAAGDPDSTEPQAPALDEGERLVRRMTHEVDPGDMTAPGAV